MRIQHLYISEYKNLKNFTLDFDGTSFIDVFVGKNGTGKSNLFEVLIEIFRHLYENDYKKVKFDYKLHYTIDDADVRINWKWEKEQFVDADGKEVKKITKKVLPDNILMYYSGHNPKVNELILEYENKFKDKVKGANPIDTREFIGIGKDYKSLLLSVLLIQPDQKKAKQFIIEKLGIKQLGSVLKIKLQRPNYAIGNIKFDVDRYVPETRYWGAKGITQSFLDKLETVKKIEDKSGTIFNGLLSAEDKYTYYFDITDFQEKFSDESSQSVFRNFDNLKTIEMLEDISIDITLNDGAKIDVHQFSDGQFQSIYIYSIIELFKDRNCITLLDEPDSFLHPEWQYEFLKQIFEITDIPTVNKNHVLMTSHSASTLAPYDNNPLINLFTIENNAVVLERITKSRAIDILSGGKINISENEARLNIIHFLNYTTGAVLFTEGISDEIILGKAWEKLYQDRPRPFEIQNAFDCAFLRNLIKRGNIFESYPVRIFFALFDFDEAYVDWNQLGTTIETDFRKCLTKKYGNYNSYNMLLPVPNIDAISRQVLNPHTGGSYENNSLLTIESLFSQVPGLAQYFAVDLKRTDGFIKFTGDKVDFAKNVIPHIDSLHFEVFRPVFDFILSVINVPAN